MIASLITSHQHQLASLAKAWLASGATAFSVWSDDTRLACWPPEAEDARASLSVSIEANAGLIGELRVAGLDSPEAQERLRADARLLSLNVTLANLLSEIEQAQRVQAGLLPEELPVVDGLDVWAASRPASHLGGDFFDFIPGRDHSLSFVVGDICGKGMPAALLMAMTRFVVRNEILTQETPTPEQVLAYSNAKLFEDFSRLGFFATVFVGQYDPAKRLLLFANSGHSPVIFCPANGKAHLLEADGTALGILAESFSCNQSIFLKKGDLLVVATDGFHEARDRHEQSFGYQRLLKLVEEQAGCAANEIGESLFEQPAPSALVNPKWMIRLS